MDPFQNNSAFTDYPDNTTLKNSTSDLSGGVSNIEELYHRIRKVLIWLSFIIVLLSLIGNSLIIIVMTRKGRGTHTVNVYLMALAVSDVLYMLNVPFHRWLSEVFDVSIYNNRLTWLLVVKMIANYTFKVTSAWMLAGVTIVRVFNVILPLKANDICTKTAAKISVCAIYICSIVLYSCLFTMIVTFNYFPNSSAINVVIIVNNGDKIFKWLDFIMAYLLPLAIIFIGSIMITLNLRRRRTSQNANSRNQSVTKILLAADITYIVTMSPAICTTLFCRENCGLTRIQHRILFESCLFIYDLNSTLNFYIYYLSGPKFRSDVKSTFYCG